MINNETFTVVNSTTTQTTTTSTITIIPTTTTTTTTIPTTPTSEEKKKVELNLATRKRRDLIQCTNCSIQLPPSAHKAHINNCTSLYSKASISTISPKLSSSTPTSPSPKMTTPKKSPGKTIITTPKKSPKSPKLTSSASAPSSPLSPSSPTVIKTRTMTGSIPLPLFIGVNNNNSSNNNESNNNSINNTPTKKGRMSSAPVLKVKKTPVKTSSSSSSSTSLSPKKQSDKKVDNITPTTSPKKRKFLNSTNSSPTNSTSSPSPNSKQKHNQFKGWSKNTISEWRIPEAPVFYPNIEEFKSPLKYIESIRPIAEKYGICKIVPPFKADSITGNINAKQFKFKTKVQNIHQLKRRWNGPNELFVSDLCEFLDKRSTPLHTLPKYDGRDLDFYTLFLEVNRWGGCNECTHTAKWNDVIKVLKVTDFCNKPIQTLKNFYHLYLDEYEIETRHAFSTKHKLSSKDQFDNLLFVNEIIQQYNQYSKFYNDNKHIIQGIDNDEKEEKKQDYENEEEEEQEGNSDENEDEVQFIKETAPTSAATTNNIQKVAVENVKKENVKKNKKKNKRLSLSSSTSLSSSDEEEEESSEEESDNNKEEESSDDENENNDDEEEENEESDDSQQEFGFYEGNIYTLEEFEILANNFSKKWFPENNNDPMTVENEFWRIVENGDENVQVHYGSDLDVTTHGSGFSRTATSNGPDEHWNLNQMPKMQESLFSHLTETIAGVTDPMMYVGMLFSSFCWHNEDNYLYSINYLHKGTYKTWYGVPGSGSEIFERVMKASVPELFEKQPNLLYLLITMISPDLLKRRHVPIYKCLQGPGEYVVTFPQAYHAGFSHGFTIAEAVNFAPPDWIPYGSSSIERYQQTHRSSVFSHEQLLYTIANRSPSCELSSWLAKEFQKIKSKENSLRNQLIKETSGQLKIEKSSKPLRKILETEPLQCFICKYDCFLSYIQCPDHSIEIEDTNSQHQWVSNQDKINNSNINGVTTTAGNGKTLKVCCLSHFEELCDCSKKKLVSIFSIDDLDKTINNIKSINNNISSTTTSASTSTSTTATTSTSTSTSTPTTRNMSSHKPVYKFPSPSSNETSPTPPLSLIFSKNLKTTKLFTTNKNNNK